METPVPIHKEDSFESKDSKTATPDESLKPQLVQKKVEDEEETALDGEFVKVERESIDVKDNTVHQRAVAVEQNPSTTNKNLSISASSTDKEEAEDYNKELKLKFEAVVVDLQNSEAEKAGLQTDMEIANKKMIEREKRCEELEIDLKRLQEEVESNTRLQLQTLGEVQEDREAKNRELVNMKVAFDRVSHDLEISRMNIEKLELDLASLADDAKKHEEHSKEKGLDAELQLKKTVEFEKMAEIAKQHAKEMEDQVRILQEEIKDLYNSVRENQKIKGALNTTTSELLKAQEELSNSKSQVEELENRVASDKALADQLAQELTAYKASDEDLKKEVLALKSLLLTSSEELQRKAAGLQEAELKYEEEVRLRENLETNMDGQNVEIKKLQEQLMKVGGENEAQEAVLAELKASLVKTEEMCNNLEDKLKISEQNFANTHSLLSQALSYNTEMEQKLKSLEEFQAESERASAIATQRGIELEGLVQSSNLAAVEVKAQLQETESKLLSVEQKNVEVEKQLHDLELQCSGKDRELKEVYEKESKLTSLLRNSEEDVAISKSNLQSSEDKSHQLEFSLSMSSGRILELEQEVKHLEEKCALHENQSGLTQQSCLDLEELLRKSHLKSKEAENKVVELELLLDATKNQLQELEEQLIIERSKRKNADDALAQLDSNASDLKTLAEALKVRCDSLEVALHDATNREKELVNQLKAITEEKEQFEQSSKSSHQKLVEAEGMITSFQNELKSTKEKLENVEELLKASNTKEQEILEKLKSAEEQLEQHTKSVETATARGLELELAHQTHSKQAELSHQESLATVAQKDSEIELLSKKIESIEEQVVYHKTQAAEATERANFFQDQVVATTQSAALVKDELQTCLAANAALEKHIDELKTKVQEAENKASFFQDHTVEATERAKLYQDQAVEVTEKAASLKAELEASTNAHVSLEKSIEELKREVQEKEAKTEQTFMENQMIAKTNSQLKEELEAHQAKIKKMQELMDSIKGEKDEMADQLNFHAKAVTELKDQHSRGLDLHAEAEARSEQTKFELLDAIEKLKAKDSEVGTLNEKLITLDSQAKVYQKQAADLKNTVDTTKVQLEEALLKINELEETSADSRGKVSQIENANESLAKTNLRLVEELTSYENKLNELQNQLDTVLGDKDEACCQLQSSTKIIEDLKQKFTSEGERLQAQIFSVKEENSVLDEMYQTTKRDLEAIITKLEEQLKEQRDKESTLSEHIETLQADLMVKSELQTRIAELEQQLMVVDKLLKEERELESRKELEREASVRQSLVDTDSKHAHVLSLEKQVEELQQKLQESEAKYKEKVEDFMNESSAKVEAERQHVVRLQKQAEELQQNLQKAESQCREKQSKAEEGISELQVGREVETKSRDFSIGTTTPLKRKNKKKDEVSHQPTETPSATPATITEDNSLSVTVKFIMGVALISMIIGVILGKRY